jgi:hypothetical protein
LFCLLVKSLNFNFGYPGDAGFLMHTDEYFLNVTRVLHLMVGVNRTAGQNPSCESKSRLSGEKNNPLLRNPNIYYRF